MLLSLHLFSLLVLVLLGFYVFVTDPRSRANQMFAAFISFLAFWTTKDLIFWNGFDDRIRPEWWAGASFLIALSMQVVLVVFAWVFPENSRTPRRKAAVLFAPSLILVPAAALGLLWTRITFDNRQFEIELSAIGYAFVAYVYFLFFYGAYLLFEKFRRYHGTQAGQQVAAVLWALMITGVLKTFANLFLPFFDNYSLLPYSSIFVIPGVFIYAYAISNFKMFSLQTALDQFRLFPITYKVALIIASVAIASFFLLQVPIVWWSFEFGSNAEAWRKYLVFSVISALVPNLLMLLLVVRSISRPLQRIALAAVRVTEGEYGTEVDIRKSNDEIGLLASSFNEMSRKMAADITQLKQLNESLIRSDRLAGVGTLAAGVAHEVNNPLAAISSMIQMIEKDALAEGKDTEDHKAIIEQIERIKRVTRDLTDFARVRPTAMRDVHVNQLIETSIRLASFDATFQTLLIETSLDPRIPMILADPDQLQQVFLNLLLNARDSMESGGRLVVRSFCDEEHISVTVADSGKGIDRSNLRRLFDPFFTTKPAGQGTGLGLAVCYGIITEHGGTIDVAETGPKGTVFLVRLPITTQSV